jgi:hypothetical protein
MSSSSSVLLLFLRCGRRGGRIGWALEPEWSDMVGEGWAYERILSAREGVRSEPERSARAHHIRAPVPGILPSICCATRARFGARGT